MNYYAVPPAIQGFAQFIKIHKFYVKIVLSIFAYR